MPGRVMGASTAELPGLGQAFDRAELARQEAAQAERAAFDRWQDAYAAYETARDDASAAWSRWAEGIAPL
jgi:hypothetical protein